MKPLRASSWLLAVIVVLLALPAQSQVNVPQSGVNFDGSTGYAIATTNVWFGSNGNNNFTVEGWVYLRTYANWSRLIDFGNGQSVDNVYVAVSAGSGGFPNLGIYTNTGGPQLTSSVQLPLNQWAHLAVTLSNTTAVMYINGAVVGSVNNMYAPHNVVRTNNYIGRSAWQANGDALVNGMFDEVRIWNVARTQAQIQSTMHRSLVGNEPGLTGYWRFDDNTGVTASDSSGHGQNVTLIGAATWTNSTAPIIAGPGGGVSFNGSQTATIVSQNAMNTYPLTLMAWFKSTNHSGAIINKYSSASDNGYQMFIGGDGGLHGWYFHDTTNNVFSAGTLSGGNVIDGLWHFGAFTVDASGGKIYVDGILKTNLAWTGTPQATTTTTPLGLGIYQGDSLWIGSEDEASVWNVSLTQAQIQNYMTHPLMGTEPGLVGYWRMDEGSGTNLSDSSPSGFAMQFNGSWIASGAAFPVSGPGYGLNFNAASNQYVQVPANPALTPAQFTFEAWVYPSNLNSQTILSRGAGTPNSTTTDYEFTIGFDGNPADNGLLKLALFTGISWDASIHTVPTNAWSHVAVTFDGTNRLFYINGVLDNAVADSATPYQSGSPLYIGRNGTALTNQMNGRLDEVRIWNVVRTSGQIQSNMNSALLGTEPGLVAYYRFDEGAGTTTLDGSTNANNGTLVNGPAWQLSTAPVGLAVTTPANTITNLSATLNGIVIPDGLNTGAWFNYGTNSTYGTKTSVTLVGNGIFTNIAQSRTISGLAATTTYHYQIVATNSGGTNYGPDASFTTTVGGPTVTVLSVSNIFTTNAMLNASVNPQGLPTTVYFIYGTTTAYGATNAFSVGSGISAVGQADNITGLAPDTVYHYLVRASNSAGVVSSSDNTFQTASLPAIILLPSTGNSSTTATLNASVNPNGYQATVTFLWGPNTNYGTTNVFTNVGSGSSFFTVPDSLSGLPSNTVFHYMAIVSSIAGVAATPDTNFQTWGPPSVVIAAASHIRPTWASLNASVNPNGPPTTVTFAYGLTTNYGSTATTLLSGVGIVPVSIAVNGLATNTTYHYMASVSNVYGTAVSGDTSFTTSNYGTRIVLGYSGDTTAPGSLRWAIAQANAASTDQIIDLSQIFSTITLTNTLPVITNGMILIGYPGRTVITGNNTFRLIFQDVSNDAVFYENLILADGCAHGGNGGNSGGGAAGMGGALFVNRGDAILESVSFSGNQAIGGSGGGYEVLNGDSYETFTGGGGGGGLGGNGGNGGPGSEAGNSGGGGGGFMGNGGTAAGAAGGGGGIYGAGGGSVAYTGAGNYGGGGGGGTNAGSSGSASSPGAGGAGGGGGGGAANQPGTNGAYLGGGGGAGLNQSNAPAGDAGGNGGTYGGGGGSSSDLNYNYYTTNGGAGGDFGGGGGIGAALGSPSATGGAGGFGGGGGGASLGEGGGGAGGFGGGGGGAGVGSAYYGSGGPFGGNGGIAGYGGGGGAALGGVLFVRATNGASLTLSNITTDAGSLTAGAAGGTYAVSGSTDGSFLFLLGGTNIINASASSISIGGTIGGWSGAPATLIKTGPSVVVLSGANDFPGTFLVTGGAAEVDGAITTAAIIVSNQSLLTGAGSVSALTCLPGSYLLPGPNIGTLFAQNTIWSGAGNFIWRVYNVGGSYSQLNITGTLDVSAAASFNIDLNTISSPGNYQGAAVNFNTNQSYTWPLVHTTGGIIGFNPANFNIVTNAISTPGSNPFYTSGGFANPIGNGSFSLAVTNNNLVLNYLPAPIIYSSSASSIRLTQAILNGSINPNGSTAQAWFEYGLNTNYGSYSATNTFPASYGSYSFSNLVTGLQPATTYHYQLVAVNSGGTSLGGDATFTTLQTFGATNEVSGPGGTVLLQFDGNPNLTYTLQQSTNLMTWSNVVQLTADTNGQFNYTATNDGTFPDLFYRLSYP